MEQNERWFASRIAWTEVALTLLRAKATTQRFADDWSQVYVIEVGRELSESAARIGADLGLRTFEALHLASAVSVDDGALTFATWDRRLWDAAGEHGFALVPAERP